MADFDADGRQDLISGCFEGGAYVLHGKEDGGFAAPQPVLDRDGKVLRVGQYWDYDAKKWSKVETSRFRDYLGISAFPVDWDADGDLDLLLGTNEGRVFVRLNEGTKEKPAFATESVAVQAGGGDLQVPGAHAMPVAADWDGDGLFDLVTGSNPGAIFWYRNTGKAGAPAFAPPQMLVETGRGGMGQRTQVAVADFDSDGRPDLLVGDFHSTQVEKKHEFHGWVWLLRRKGPEKTSG